MTKICIIIVTDNSKETIMRAVNSAIDNSRKPDSIIIGDNDSDDETYDHICDQMSIQPVQMENGDQAWPGKADIIYKDIPITVFRKHKSTIGSTLNICINVSPQDTTIYGFLQSFDWYELDAIEKVLKAWDTDANISCLISNSIDHFENGRKFLNIKQSYDAKTLHQEYSYDPNLFVPKRSLQKLGKGFAENMQKLYDYELLLRLFRIGIIYHIPDFLLNHTIQSKSIEELVHTQTMIKQMGSKS